MHHALELQEILSAICHNFAPSFDPGDKKPDPSLVALAKTCRAFKEPALDALWMVLKTLDPLSRCLPELVCRPDKSLTCSYSYAFSRQLTQADWKTFRSYARRIRCVHSFSWSSHYAYFELLSESGLPTTEPLFPSLRHLHCRYNKITMPLLNLPLPSLTNLIVEFENLESFQASFDTFLSFSQGLKTISISVLDQYANSCRMPPNYLSRWKNLSSVVVPQFILDEDDLAQLSSTVALNTLVFSPSATLPLLDSPLPFANLQHLKLYSKSLSSISRLLLQSRLPAITDFQSCINVCPSKEELETFLAGLLASNAGRTIKVLEVTQSYASHIRPHALALGFEDLEPCMAFANLVRLSLNFACTVCLTDRDLLTLAAAWPKLEDLRINSGQGWSSDSKYGITPNGLFQLWRTCRSLRDIHVRLDTRGYGSDAPSSEAPAHLGGELALPPTVRINALDAAIEADAVRALAAFLCGVAAACCGSGMQLSYWGALLAEQPRIVKEFRARWEEVRARVYGPRVYSVGTA